MFVLLLGQVVFCCLLRRQHDIGMDGGADQPFVRIDGLPFITMVASRFDSLRRGK